MGQLLVQKQTKLERNKLQCVQYEGSGINFVKFYEKTIHDIPILTCTNSPVACQEMLTRSKMTLVLLQEF